MSPSPGPGAAQLPQPWLNSALGLMHRSLLEHYKSKWLLRLSDLVIMNAYMDFQVTFVFVSIDYKHLIV